MTAYRHVGGNIVCNGRFMTDAEVAAQADLAQRERNACRRKGLSDDARVAQRLFLEITDALAEQDAWRQCGRAAPDQQTIEFAMTGERL